MRFKVLAFGGTLAEFQKLWPILQELGKLEDIQPLLAVTKRHDQVLDQTVIETRVEPDFVMHMNYASLSLGHLTNQVLKGFDNILQQSEPDFVLIHGDKTTALAAALACFYRHVEVGHHGAGFRTNDPYIPFPEEMNRRLITQLTTLHFPVNEAARSNLVFEHRRVCLSHPEQPHVPAEVIREWLKGGLR